MELPPLMYSQTVTGSISRKSLICTELEHMILWFLTLQRSLVLIHYHGGLLGWLLMYTHTKYIPQKTNTSITKASILPVTDGNDFLIKIHVHNVKITANCKYLLVLLTGNSDSWIHCAAGQ